MDLVLLILILWFGVIPSVTVALLFAASTLGRRLAARRRDGLAEVVALRRSAGARRSRVA